MRMEEPAPQTDIGAEDGDRSTSSGTTTAIQILMDDALIDLLLGAAVPAQYARLICVHEACELTRGPPWHCSQEMDTIDMSRVRDQSPLFFFFFFIILRSYDARNPYRGRSR